MEKERFVYRLLHSKIFSHALVRFQIKAPLFCAVMINTACRKKNHL